MSKLVSYRKWTSPPFWKSHSRYLALKTFLDKAYYQPTVSLLLLQWGKTLSKSTKTGIDINDSPIFFDCVHHHLLSCYFLVLSDAYDDSDEDEDEETIGKTFNLPSVNLVVGGGCITPR